MIYLISCSSLFKMSSLHWYEPSWKKDSFTLIFFKRHSNFYSNLVFSVPVIAFLYPTASYFPCIFFLINWAACLLLSFLCFSLKNNVTLAQCLFREVIVFMYTCSCIHIYYAIPFQGDKLKVGNKKKGNQTRSSFHQHHSLSHSCLSVLCKSSCFHEIHTPICSLLFLGYYFENSNSFITWS